MVSSTLLLLGCLFSLDWDGGMHSSGHLVWLPELKLGSTLSCPIVASLPTGSGVFFLFPKPKLGFQKHQDSHCCF